MVVIVSNVFLGAFISDIIVSIPCTLAFGDVHIIEHKPVSMHVHTPTL